MTRTLYWYLNDYDYDYDYDEGGVKDKPEVYLKIDYQELTLIILLNHFTVEMINCGL